MRSMMCRFRVKVLGLSLFALCGVGAFMAGSVQGNWLENGKEVTANKEVLTEAYTIIELQIPSLNVEIRCTTIEGKEIKLLASSEKGEGKVAFSGCTTWWPAGLKGTAQPKCTPEKQPIVWGGTVLLVLLAKTKGGALKNYVLFSPSIDIFEEEEVVLPFTTITLPSECALLKTSTITGSLVAECGTLVAFAFASEDCNLERVLHLLRPGPTVWFKGKEDAEEVKDALKVGLNAMTLAGVGAVELVSRNSWAGHV